MSKWQWEALLISLFCLCDVDINPTILANTRSWKQKAKITPLEYPEGTSPADTLNLAPSNGKLIQILYLELGFCYNKYIEIYTWVGQWKQTRRTLRNMIEKGSISSKRLVIKMWVLCKMLARAQEKVGRVEEKHII